MPESENSQKIELHNVRVHNLKSVSLSLEPNQLICFTGVSGSGKTSLAFDTIFIEGQRRYIESLSQQARRFLGDLPKPDLDMASGITPTISIEQKTTGKNPRSTIGTITEIYDYFRVLWARSAIAYCPVSGEPVKGRSKEEIIEEVLKYPPKTRLMILAPYARGKKGEFKDDIEAIAKKGFTRIRVDQTIWLLDQEIPLDKNSAHDVDIVVDRVEIASDVRARLTESIFMALEIGEGACIVLDAESEEETFLSTKAYSAKSGISYSPLDPHDFSFNSPSGMCPDCQGMGVMHQFDLSKIIDPTKSIAQDCCLVGSSYATVRYGNIYDNLARLNHFDVHTPWQKLSDEAKKVFLHGTEKKWTRMLFMHPETGATWHDLVQWRGVLFDAYKRYQEAKSDLYKKKLEQYMHKGICPTCKGGRLRAYPLAALFCGKSIAEVTHMTVEGALRFFSGVTLSPYEEFIARPLVKEIIERLVFLVNVGLDYLQIDRTAPTLSGGESQRVRLASQIGSGLVGATYILDEPSIGLHVRDNKKLITSLENLRDKGNTVIVIEHDEETIRASDFVVDVGPKAGLQGGEIVYQGPVAGLVKCKASLTGSYLAKRLEITLPEERRAPADKWIEISGARHNNLKNVSVSIPLGCFVAITGVSGSGKSSLFLETLFPALSNRLMKSELTVGDHDAITGIDHIDKVIEIDQSPIGRTPRSNPATYIKLFDDIRLLFSQLPQSQAKGYKPGRFSFNSKAGSCSECNGIGMLKLDMDFLEDSWVDCPLCRGQRFDQETLEVRYKGKNIRDVLEMDVNEALEHFGALPHIVKKLQMLARVGLDYMKLGQASTTLSGGEAQRIKLVKELARPDTGKTLYILDEPTTGLHFHDMNHLIDVLQALVDKGNTVVVIEHNIDLIRTCDWIIEMGPESGQRGGQVIASGSPEEIAEISCATGEALASTAQHKKKTKKQSHWDNTISVVGAEQNNLKKCTTELPRGKLTVCAGPSGSGKSSFAFETLFAEGQRRYVESLSPYVRQFVKQMPKPKVERVEGLSASIAIEQRLHSTNPRSTVGTMTEIYDYLRILYSRVGIPHCPKTKARIQAISKDHVVDRLLSYPEGERLHILAPIEIKRTESFDELCERLQRQGYVRIRLNGKFYELGEPIAFDHKRKNELFLVVDRFTVDPALKNRMLEAVAVASELGRQKLVVMRGEKDVFFNLAFAVEETGESYPEITPQTFAFNTVYGMCPECQGLGFVWGVDITAIPLVTAMTPLQLVQMLWGEDACNRTNRRAIDALFKLWKIDPKVAIKKQSVDLYTFFNGASDGIELKIDGIPVRLKWKGVNHALAAAIKFRHESSETPLPDEWQISLKENECASCHGDRLNPLARHVTINDLSIADLSRLSIEKASDFVTKIEIEEKEDLTLKQVHDELKMRLSFLSNIGLTYLSLSRRASTLSGGEAQRVRLARQIGSGLTGILYVLDEPTIGLHPQDCGRLNEALNTLKELGNTLVIVEHDSQMIMQADHVIEFGPASGAAGGQIVATGSPQELLSNPKSLTASYLQGSQFVDLKRSKKKTKKEALFTIKNAKVNNLKNITLQIPTGAFTCLTGVSGSGKSSLLDGVLREGIAKSISQKSGEITTPLYSLKGVDCFTHLISMDQRPIGHTLRSDVATYTDILTPIRHFFAALPEAKMRGLEPKHFSTYHRKGMCSTCWGLGYKKIEMHFLPAVKTACPQCHGLRLNPASLAITYKGKNLGQMLQLSIDEVKEIFSAHPKVCRPLDTLIDVGLGYLNLGQEMQTLSGGESQRIKLSRELSKRPRGQALYLFDEPTTGLHPQEIYKLVTIIYDLVSKGHTVIAIEHNIDFVRCADHLIDLGPGAGDEGGTIVAEGSVAEIAACSKSLTGRFLH